MRKRALIRDTTVPCPLMVTIYSHSSTCTLRHTRTSCTRGNLDVYSHVHCMSSSQYDFNVHRFPFISMVLDAAETNGNAYGEETDNMPIYEI